MYMFDLEKQCLLKDVLLENLKLLGVRCRIPKKSKEYEKENVYFPEYQIFQKPLQLLKMCSVPRLNGTLIEVPEFLVDACAVIERDIRTEGIFRRAGSTCKQRESKALINQGKKLSSDFHVFDACSLVKHFFRELPQPLIPYDYHKIIMSCLLLSTQKKQIEALMLVCLLLPLENLRTLAFFMEFLLKVSKYSDVNKMNKKNLAIILTPTLMPAQEGRSSNSMDMTHNFKILELLIENSEKIGLIPEHIEECMTNEKFKKKKRSGSLTRMFTGLKKIVGNKGANTPDWDDSSASTPGSLSSLGKRKNSQSSVASNMIAKRKRVLQEGDLLATPLRCRMHGYVTPVSFESVVPGNLKKANSGSPPGKNRRNNSKSTDDEGHKTSNSNIVKRCLIKKQKSLSKMGSTSSIGNLFNLGNSKTSLDRRLSGISWGGRKKTLSNLFLNKSENDYHEEELSENTIDSSDSSELITVHKSEYEDIKNRVTALEEEIEMLNAAHSVQSAYERTLEESEMINLGATDHLARRLSKELKIRRSSDNKVIRSPSARKIGSIRRRSKESLQRSAEQKSSLRRGRPNTLQSGLPSPAGRRVANTPEIPDEKETRMQPEADQEEGEVDLSKNEWQSGDKFFARDYLLQKLMPVPQGRPSIVEIRNQNAGMVLEKAKLFNSLTEAEKDERDTKLQKRHSIRLEHLRRLKEMEMNHGASSGELKSSGVLRSQSLRKNVAYVSPQPQIKNTPLRPDTMKIPVIKESLNTRSPRSLAKTPMKIGGRTRATPIRALLDPYGTPRVGVRRSPRILARTLTSSPRPNP